MADLADIKSRISCPDVLEMLEVPGPDASGKIPCFGHDEATPSLHIWDDHWRAFCCGRGGDIFDLVQFATGASTTKAIAFLEGVADGFEAVVRRTSETARELRDFGERLTLDASLGNFYAGQDFVKERWPHLDIDFLGQAGVVAGPYHLLIPHHDEEGVVRGVKTRVTVGDRKGEKGAWTGSTFTTRLYRHTDILAPRPKAVVLVEGESDCWTATMALRHRAQVLALPSGAATIKPHFLDELARYERVILALDSDEAGREATATVLEGLNPRVGFIVESFTPAPYKDVTEWVLDGNIAFTGLTRLAAALGLAP